MRLSLFFKLFLISFAVSLAVFAFIPNSTLMFLAKSIALGTGISIVITLFYPDLRGVRTGDIVSVVLNSSVHSLIGRVGRATTNARRNSEIRVRFENGEEAVGVVESYSGILSPPKVRVIYEEKIVEQ